MSFDLWIHRPGSRSISRNDLLKACSHRPWFRVNDEGEVFFSHPDTDVTFHLSHRGDHVAFNMNMARPPYWGRQAMPVVVEIIDALGAVTDDPQADDADTRRERGADELIRSWEQANNFGLSSLAMVFKQHPGAEMPHARATAEQQDEWFDYMRSRWRRQAGTEALWYPRILWVGEPQAPGKLAQAQRLVVWNPDRTLLLPQTELVHLYGKGLDRIVEVKALMKVLADSIFDVSDDVPLWRCNKLDFEGRAALGALEGRRPLSYQRREPAAVITHQRPR